MSLVGVVVAPGSLAAELCEVRGGRGVHCARRAPAPLWSRCESRRASRALIIRRRGWAARAHPPRPAPRSARPRTTHP